ncbi:GyrI-like domain-containing protein [Chitinophaga sp. GCM10012297]|uniref:GyrI-like domain-containing protein n=1 Tax=Chitinophaga chungangae TaxID=2821488 RepID=A0ABS3YCZ6_9BACT|nr:GyrI-like domain-containing protein [Chitinophaga chungangae]MBO9152555.1 GyrI-like domain-containing protein [Chitinophaga chungangae]
MQKTDLSKEQKQYYRAKTSPELVAIAAANFITVEGSGDPDSSGFHAKTKALYATAYNIKKINKLQNQDFRVAPLEGFWWTEAGEPVGERPRDEWHWKLQIQLPAFVVKNDFKQAAALAGNKNLRYLGELQWETQSPSLAVQVLHTGSYKDETASVKKLRDYIEQHHLEITGAHHEIYLSDPNKTAPEKLNTILRLEVKSAKI